MYFEFGKYEGYHVSEVPTNYLQWLFTRNLTTMQGLRSELQRRGFDPVDLFANVKPPNVNNERGSNFTAKPSVEVAVKLIAAGFRSLSREMHPDTGGNAEKFGKLQATRQFLDKIAASGLE